jgi:hypothetical protein
MTVSTILGGKLVKIFTASKSNREKVFFSIEESSLNALFVKNLAKSFMLTVTNLPYFWGCFFVLANALLLVV